MHTYEIKSSLLNIAHNTQYCTFAGYLSSFSRDSRRDIVWLYMLSRNMEEGYQHIYMDYMF